MPRDFINFEFNLPCCLENTSTTMAFRNPVRQLTRRATQSTISKLTSTPTTSLWQRSSADQLRGFATPVPPVTQDATSSKGPTAMVFMNMGGPATTDEVGGFLSRLFVRHPSLALGQADFGAGRFRLDPPGPIPELSRTTDIESSNTQDSKAVCCHWRRIADSQVVRVPSCRDVQDPR